MMAALRAPITTPMVQDATVVELYPTSGLTCAWQLPRTRPVAASGMAKVMVDGPFAGRIPPMFFSDAATTQAEPHPGGWTDSTAWIGVSAGRLGKSSPSVGATI